MKKLAQCLTLVAALGAVPVAALAREAVPIVEYSHIQVMTTTGKAVTADQVRDAIVAAAQARSWVIARSPSQNLLSATLNVRGRHSVVVSIPYSVEDFSIKYQSSVNMKYSVAQPAVAGSGDVSSIPAPAQPAGGPLIHPYYNRWVQDLLQGIQQELKKL